MRDQGGNNLIRRLWKDSDKKRIKHEINFFHFRPEWDSRKNFSVVETASLCYIYYFIYIFFIFSELHFILKTLYSKHSGSEEAGSLVKVWDSLL